MRKVFIGLTVFLAAVAAVSGFLSPPAFWLCDVFAEIPFHRVFNRVIMLGALIALWPLARYWRVDSWRKMGIYDPRWRSNWFTGLLLGVVTMIILFDLQFLAGVRAWEWKLTWPKAGEFLASALAIGLLEEILFRGLLFYAVKDFLGKWLATWAGLNSLFFATVHFIKAKNLDSSVTWLSGWETWAVAWPSWEQFSHLFPRWLSLFLVGLVLCAAVWRWKSLWPAIGLHSGWVFVLKTGQRTTEHHAASSFWLGADVTTGFCAVALLLITLFLLLYFPKRLS